MKARIADIKSMAIHDGPGIRTTVFFKGCGLKCLWCHNPETISSVPQLAFYETKCQHCLACAAVCAAHKAAELQHHFDRGSCLGCGSCVSQCLQGALQLFGTEVTAEALLPRLLEDRAFYETTGGGVTLSGGECLLQADFCAALLEALKKEGIHTAVDTCGFVQKAAFEKVLPYTDIFLVDIKAIDPQVHKACTGQENGMILDNIRYLDSVDAQMEFRIPFVPGCNDREIPAIRDFLKTLKGSYNVKVLPYHNYAGSKYAALGMENTLPPTIPTEAQIAEAEALLR
ncbi:MAG: glycyl-radical enzyme activating protein [Oscillospiraceae bacterium]|nr:glycyl-radical enzyme activating protein [Oscillospiraceae bacterium]